MSNTLSERVNAAIFGKKKQLDYALTTVGNVNIFQVVNQSEEVTNFLKRNGTFMASNGIRVAVSKFPEIKESINTVFLRGDWKHEDLKTDHTIYGSPFQAKAKAKMYEEALAELVETVKGKTYYSRSYQDDLAAQILRAISRPSVGLPQVRIISLQ